MTANSQRGTTSRTPSLPMYHRIARAIQGRIFQGVYRLDELIPSEAELSREFGVTRLTVRQAIGELRNAGVLFARQGAGTYVSRDAPLIRPVNFIGDLQDVLAQAPEIVFVSARQVRATELVREKLELKRGARVLFMELTRSHHAEVVLHAHNYVPAQLARRLTTSKLMRTSLVELLPVYLGLPLTDVYQTLTAAPAPPQVAKRLGIRVGSPTLHSEMLFYSDSMPAMVSYVYYRPDRVSFTASLSTPYGEHIRPASAGRSQAAKKSGQRAHRA